MCCQSVILNYKRFCTMCLSKTDNCGCILRNRFTHSMQGCFCSKVTKILTCNFYCQTNFGFSCFLVVKGLLCNLGSLLQEFRLLKFDGPKSDSVRAKACLTGQHDRRLPVSYLQPCFIGEICWFSAQPDLSRLLMSG